MAVTAGSRKPVLLAPVHCAPKALSSPSTSNCPSLHHCERGSPMKNRKREICTSGSVRDEDGQPPHLLGRRNFLHLAAGAAALPAVRGTTPVPPEPGPSPTVSKKFVADFGAPTDGVTSANAALNRWKQFGRANPGAELVIEAGKYQFPQGFAPLYGSVNPTITGAGSDKTELVTSHMVVGTNETFPQVRRGFVPIATVDAGAAAVTVLNSSEMSKL